MQPHQQQQQQQYQLHQPNNGQQQQQQQAQQQQQQGMPAAGPAPANAEPPMTLAGVLHFLQVEHRKYERDRNEWEIERAEMRARIALLEGERRSAENLKVDMTRRVKMLEYAIRQERSKFLATQQGASFKEGASITAPGGGKVAELKEGSTGSSPRSEDVSLAGLSTAESSALKEAAIKPILLSNGVPPTIPEDKSVSLSRTDSSNGVGSGANPAVASTTATSANSMPPALIPAWKKGVAAAGRDLKSRMKSREYLKQCLQEITYLTSPGAMNPLPNRQVSIPSELLPSTSTVPHHLQHQQQPGPSSSTSSALPPPPPQQLQQQPQQNFQSLFPSIPPTSTFITRPKKVMPEQIPPSVMAHLPTDEERTPDSEMIKELPPPPPPALTKEEKKAREEEEAQLDKDVQEIFAPDEKPAETAAPPQLNGNNDVDVAAASDLLPSTEEISTHSFESELEAVASSDPVPKSAPLANIPLPLAADEKGLPLPSEQLTSPSTVVDEEVTPPSAEPSTAAAAVPSPLTTDVASTTKSIARKNGGEILTAIFRPNGASTTDSEWSEQLKRAGVSLEKKGLGEDDEDLRDVKLDEDDLTGPVTVSTSSSDGMKELSWKGKWTMKSHLDAVRAIAFHPTQKCLASVSEDCTLKVWNVTDAAMNGNSTSLDPVPGISFRGHTAGLTSVAFSPRADGIIFTSSLDQSIRLWKLPSGFFSSKKDNLFEPCDVSLSVGELIGHTDAVWDLAVIPGPEDSLSLVSVSADGSVKVWDASKPGCPLKLSWSYTGIGEEAETDAKAVIPLCVGEIKTKPGIVAVAWSNGIVVTYDVKNGQENGRYNCDQSYDGSPNTQINCIISHPTKAIIITAHEDSYIRIVDLETGALIKSFLAHTDGVTSLALLPASPAASPLTSTSPLSDFELASVSHDCSLRIWHISSASPFVSGSNNHEECVQEVTLHRKNKDQGVLAVAVAYGMLATAGSDSSIRILTKS